MPKNGRLPILFSGDDEFRVARLRFSPLDEGVLSSSRSLAGSGVTGVGVSTEVAVTSVKSVSSVDSSGIRESTFDVDSEDFLLVSDGRLFVDATSSSLVPGFEVSAGVADFSTNGSTVVFSQVSILGGLFAV